MQVGSHSIEQRAIPGLVTAILRCCIGASLRLADESLEDDIPPEMQFPTLFINNIRLGVGLVRVGFRLV